MLELFRKYSLLAFVVLILLFLGLIFMVDGVGQNGMGSGPKLMSFKGKGYTQSEVERQGADYANMFQSLQSEATQSIMIGGFMATSPDDTAYIELMPYMQTVMSGDKLQYMANRLLLDDLAEQYGATPSEAQVEDFIKTTLFIDGNGEFDQASYAEFVEKRVQRYGLGVQDLNKLVGEVISLKTLQKIVGKGLSLDGKVTEMQAKVAGEKITYEQFTLSAGTLQKSLEVTDEDVKAYWEKNKNDYLAEPKKKIQYVISDAQLAQKTQAGEVAALENAKKEGKVEEKAEYKLPEAEKSKYVNAAGDKIDLLFVNIQDAEGAGFKSLAEKLNLKVSVTELFTKENLPQDLKALQSEKKELLEMIFSLPASGGMTSISDVVSLGEGQFMLFQVIDEKQAEPLSYEKVATTAKNDFLHFKAGQLLEEKMESVKEELAKRAPSETMSDVAESLELTYNKRSDTTRQKPIDSEPSSEIFFDKAAQTVDNAFSDVIIQNTPKLGLQRAVIIRPLERSFTYTEAQKASIESQEKQLNNTLERAVFSNWFKHNLAQANFVRL